MTTRPPEPKRATDSTTLEGVWWCNSHSREATHIRHDGTRCCAPRLGGILLPCFTVFAPMTVERVDET